MIIENANLPQGTRGKQGAEGAQGNAGKDAITTLLAGFTVPAVNATVRIEVYDTRPCVGVVRISGAGVYSVTARISATEVDVVNTGTFGNAVAGTFIPAENTVSLFTGFVDPTTTTGDLIFRGASGLTRLPLGEPGQALFAQAGGPAWSNVVSGGGGGTGEIITTDALTFYVNAATGDDVSGDGTAALPYQTLGRVADRLARAVVVPASNIIHPAITIEMAAGSYEGARFSSAGGLPRYILTKAAAATRANTIITSLISTNVSMVCENITITQIDAGNCLLHMQDVRYRNIAEWGTAASSASVSIFDYARLTLGGTQEFPGAAASTWSGTWRLYRLSRNCVIDMYATVTFDTLGTTLNFGTVAFSGFIFASESSVVYWGAAVTTVGTFAGVRYHAYLSSGIFVPGASTTHFPGSIAGFSTVGSTYGAA
jgi:hypothetical protein